MAAPTNLRRNPSCVEQSRSKQQGKERLNFFRVDRALSPTVRRSFRIGVTFLQHNPRRARHSSFLRMSYSLLSLFPQLTSIRRCLIFRNCVPKHLVFTEGISMPCLSSPTPPPLIPMAPPSPPNLIRRASPAIMTSANCATVFIVNFYRSCMAQGIGASPNAKPPVRIAASSGT